MKTGDLVRKFGVSEATIRRWSTTFAEFLSEGEGRHRNFMAEDVVVIATIYKLSSEGYTQDLIQKRLQEGFRVEGEVLDEIGYPDGRMVPAAVVEQVIDSSQLRVEIEQIRLERDRLLQELNRERERNSSLEARVEGLQSRIEELILRAGLAEGRLKEIDLNRKTKDSE